jgi:hypothetical protein
VESGQQLLLRLARKGVPKSLCNGTKKKSVNDIDAFCEELNSKVLGDLYWSNFRYRFVLDPRSGNVSMD